MEKEKHETLITRILSIFYARPNEFISTMLVGNNITLVMYGIWMAKLIEQTILVNYVQNELALVGIETVISTAIILLTGEFLPKTFFKINPNGILKVLSIPAYLFYILLYPFSKLASWCSVMLLRIAGIRVEQKTGEQTFTKVDLDYFIQSSLNTKDSQKEIDAEVQIFRNALDFSNIKVRDCMKPRTEIVAEDISVTVEELTETFIATGYSKIVIYKEDIDHVIGYIHSSEMFKELTNWRESLRTLPIVPETMSGHNLMRLFAQKKRTLAIVVDEFGGTSGIVAMEDLLETIFGEIEDEHDVRSIVAKQTGEKEYILSGRLDIERANELFHIGLPESDDYQTVGGYILHVHQSFPQAKDTILIDHFEFTMLKVKSTKIELVKLRVL